MRILMLSGLSPTAILVLVLNLVIPEQADQRPETKKAWTPRAEDRAPAFQIVISACTLSFFTRRALGMSFDIARAFASSGL